MKDTSKVQIHGTGHTYVTIPKGIAEQIQYKQGEKVKFNIEGAKLVIERA